MISPYSFDFSKDGRQIIELFETGDQCIWEIEDGQALRPRAIRSRRPWRDYDYWMLPPSTVPFSPDGRWGLTFDYTRAALVWRLGRQGRPVRRFDRFSEDGVALALLTDNAVVLQNFDGATFVGSIEGRGRSLGPSLGARAEMTVSRDGSLLALSTGARIGAWELSSGAARLPETKIRLTGSAFAFTDDGRRLVGVGTDGALHTWEITPSAANTYHSVPLRAGEFSRVWVAPGARHLVGWADGTLTIYRIDVSSAAVHADVLPTVFFDHDITARASFSRDGARVVLGSTNTSWLIELAGPRIEAILTDELYRGDVWAIDPSGRLLSTHNKLSLWTH